MIRAWVGALLLVVTTIAWVMSPSPASADEEPSVTITVSDPRVTLGTEVTVSGRAPALRSVMLELRTASGDWMPVGRSLTGLTGTYTFVAPGWYGAHRLRVRVLKTLLAPAATSASRTVEVRTPYRPAGSRSDWTWLGSEGARWNPCETVTYQLNPRGGYRGASADLAAAFSKVSRIAGFQIRDRGTTTAEVTRGKRGYHPPDIDIVVDWQSPNEEPGLAGNVSGIGGNWTLAGRRFDGWVLLDSSQSLSRRRWKQVMTHELGHVFGLGHATSPSQVMYGTSSDSNARWGAGDLAGLWHVGASQGCLS